MQRWFFLDDAAKLDEEPPLTSVSSKKVIKPAAAGCRKWTFNLTMRYDMLPNEVVAVTGESGNLGNWQPDHCVPMKQDEDSNKWVVSVNIPRQREIQYRYLVCAVDPITKKFIVRRWETHFTPRVIPERENKYESHDIFGHANGLVRIDRGWLTWESIVQFHFFNAPFVWNQRMQAHVIYVKITPMNLRTQDKEPISQAPLDDSSSSGSQESGGEPPIFCFTEVARLEYNDSVIRTQPQFGTACGPEDLVLFHITVGDPENVAYLIDLYAYSSKATKDEPPYHLGYHYVLPSLITKTGGKLDVPITCATKHRPLGVMKLQYLWAKPFKRFDFDMRASYARYWNMKRSGLDVGHRGSGPTFKARDQIIRENTIASLKKAAENGADMVEFDVQLSKDLVPVVFHDFDVYVHLKSKEGKIDVNNLIMLPVRDLTLEQLQGFKVYHVSDGQESETAQCQNEDMGEMRPFPLLAEVLDAINPYVAFNIEIKWSQMLYDGTMESVTASTVDRNTYVDCILDVVMEKGCGRRLIFSGFDPDICTLLRYKQNIYPVMFLTQGITIRYPEYDDPRCNTIERAVCSAKAMEMLGIVAHTENLLNDPTQVHLATNKGLIVFCWGEDNNSKDAIKRLKGMGLHAVIYDKMESLTSKEVRESIFLVEAREAQAELFKLQCVEFGKRRPKEPQQPFLVQDRVLELEDNRQRQALSTATSIVSLLEQTD